MNPVNKKLMGIQPLVKRLRARMQSPMVLRERITWIPMVAFFDCPMAKMIAG
ncbi:MAG: hypothetical protein IKJ76_08565 [Fibrobacter sp.]|nr:hypothetical protein [Fibrobacter sp.]